jgi:UDP-N-acetylglucosamine/UDP-N-acetylgalactosamine diphosphorylase
MTSPATDGPTREFFATHDHFGLPALDVVFFEQGMVPSFDFEGQLILERPDRIFESPNGHGGAITALLASGALDDMEHRGADVVFYYQVDNPLVRIGDPVYLGFHAMAEAEMSCKVVRKVDPQEKVGVVARIRGRTGIVEYTELSDDLRLARDSQGNLVYWAGSIAVHVFDTRFLRRVAADADRVLPYHPSSKKIPTVDAGGQPVIPDAPNGRKLERFVFDALSEARAVCVVEADRRDEYSPVKNATGSESPETARRDLSAQVRRWLAAAGAPELPEGISIQLDHARIDAPGDALAFDAAALAPGRELVAADVGAEA